MAASGREGEGRDRPDLWAGIHEHERTVVSTGSAAEIKALYSELGERLDEAYAEDPEGVPALSRPETLAAIEGLFGTVRGRILDAGCGPNPIATTTLGTGPGRTMVGLDLGFATVRLARTVAERSGVELLAVVGDLEALPFAPRVFDALICDDTLEHVPDDATAVLELARVLRADGRMVLATPNRWNLEIVLRKIRDRVRGRRIATSAYFVASSHLREYRWGELQALVAGAFRVRTRARVGWRGSRKKRLASRLVELPGLRNFDQMLVIEAEVR